MRMIVYICMYSVFIYVIKMDDWKSIDICFGRINRLCI